jgi:hypothetical protein
MSGRLPIEGLDGKAHRTGEALSFIAFTFPHVQEVRTGRDKPLYLVMANLHGHDGDPSLHLQTPPWYAVRSGASLDLLRRGYTW